jgi:UDP-N-acetylmuramate dehydrogenase
MDERLKISNMKNETLVLKENYPKNIYLNEKLSNYSWFNLGGPAEIFFRPSSSEQLSSFIKKNKKNINIIGAGSNTLIRDGGIQGVTIKLGSKFSNIKKIENNLIEVGAATLDKKISDFGTENSISGFEFLSAIPGSIGGGVIMNSGCYGYEISKILVSIEVMNLKTGEISEINREEIKFFYRGCDLSKNLLIIKCKLRGNISNKELVKKKQIKIIHDKKQTQPNNIKTCGSTFKNTINKKAWELIKQSNCENLIVGKAQISEKHCNFFINNGCSKSAEIEELISKVRNKVFQETGINLELEIKIVGNKI